MVTFLQKSIKRGSLPAPGETLLAACRRGMSLLGLASVGSSSIVAAALVRVLVLGSVVVVVVGPEGASGVSLIGVEAGSVPWPILSGLSKNPVYGLVFLCSFVREGCQVV